MILSHCRSLYICLSYRFTVWATPFTVLSVVLISCFGHIIQSICLSCRLAVLGILARHAGDADLVKMGAWALLNIANSPSDLVPHKEDGVKAGLLSIVDCDSFIEEAKEKARAALTLMAWHHKTSLRYFRLHVTVIGQLTLHVSICMVPRRTAPAMHE